MPVVQAELMGSRLSSLVLPFALLDFGCSEHLASWKVERPKCFSKKGSDDALARLLPCLESGISSFLFTFLTQL